MAGLADDWEENRQTCVDVLCAYLRMPYEPDPGQDAPEPQRLAFQAIREVRHTVIRVITAHLKEDAAVSWQGLNFDFTGVVFDGGDFGGARFSGGEVSFERRRVLRRRSQLRPQRVLRRRGQLQHAEFSGGAVNFNAAQFSGGDGLLRRRRVLRRRCQLHMAQFSGGTVHFGGARFSGGTVDFRSRPVLRRHGRLCRLGL